MLFFVSSHATFLAGAALAQAMQALINYLTQIRPSVVPNASARNDADYTLTADLAQIIDTSLLKAYVAMQCLRLDNVQIHQDE